MTPEDRLREILLAEPATVRGDGLARIQQRLARRRRLRFVLPTTVLVAAAAVGVFVLAGGGGTQKLVQTPATGAPTSDPSPAPTATVVAPSTPLYDGPALWPFTSAEQASAWDAATRPWAANPEELVQHFLDDFVRQPAARAALLPGSGLGGPGTQRVAARVAGRTVSIVTVHRYTAAGPWTVTEAAQTGMVVTTPRAGDTVTNPTVVSGTLAQAADENVRLELITAAGKQIGQGGAPAGSAVPWQGSLAWSDQSWTTAGIVGTTYSLKDGALTRLAVVPVTRAVASGPTFAGLKSGYVALFDGNTGAQVRQLTYPPTGASDTGLAYHAGTLVWVRTQPTGCHDSLHRQAGGTTSTLLADGKARLSSPRLSPDAALIAWTQSPCDSDQRSVVVHGGGAPDRVLVAPAGMTATVLDLTDSGAMLVHLNDLAATDAGTLGLLPAGATSFTPLRPLAPVGSCYLNRAAAFDNNATAWETCNGRSRLVPFGASGERGTAGPLVAATVVSSASARDGQQLLEVRSRSGGPTVARYDGHLLTFLTSCEAGRQDCVASPAW